MLRCRGSVWSLIQQLMSLDHLCTSPVDQASSSLSAWYRDAAFLITSCSNIGVWKRKNTDKLRQREKFCSNSQQRCHYGHNWGKIHSKWFCATHFTLWQSEPSHERGKNGPLRACLHGELGQISVRCEVMCRSWSALNLFVGALIQKENGHGSFTTVTITQKQSKVHFLSRYPCRA